MARLQGSWVWFVCVLLWLSACAAQTTQPTVDVVYMLAQNPATLDPHAVTDAEAGIILRQVYDTLLYRDPATNEIVPGLATDWSVSEDGLVYTFRLREDVTFHDGTRFDAVAVGVNLDRIIRLDGYPASLLRNYRSHEVVDSHTIRIRLRAPFSPLPHVLSQYYFGIAGPLALGEVSDVRYQFHQVGTGPFRMVDFVPGSHAVLERVENRSWQPAFYREHEGYSINRMEFRFVPDSAARTQAIESGEAAIASDVSPADARALTVNTSVRVLPTAVPGQPVQFLMNTLNAPTDERLVRQALLYGTNRNEIVEVVYEGFSPVAWGPLSSYTLYYSREMTGLYDYDITQARTLLEQAGYTDSDEDGLVDLDGDPLQVTVMAQSETFEAQVAQLLREQWRIIGVDVVLDLQPTQTSLAGAIATGDYNLVAWHTLGIDPYYLFDYYSTDGATNWTGYQQETLDDLLLTAMESADPVTRAGAYVQAQRTIMNDALVLPIREVVNLNVVQADVLGLRYATNGHYPLLYELHYPGAAATNE